MGTVHGQVVCKESALGIKGLVVEALDVPDAELAATPTGRTALPRVRRLSSGFTREDGGFVLTFGEAEEQPEAINLLIVVSGPEETNGEPTPLFVSPRVRPHAAAQESYFIQITEDQLKQAGITPPGIKDDQSKPVDVARRRIIGASEDDVQIADAQIEASTLKVERAAKVARAFQADFLPKIQERLSRVNTARAASETFIADGDPIDDATTTIIAKDLGDTINEGGNKAPIKVRFALTDAQRDEVTAALDGGRISRTQLTQILGEDFFANELEYIADDPLAVLTRNLSEKERSAAEALGIEIQPPEPDPTTTQPTVPGTTDVLSENAAALEEGDIDRFLGRLTANMTSPEEDILAGVEPKATQKDLSTRMQNLKFMPSPAEVCAFYDFSHLQIAFRHIWQEAIDEGVLSLAEAAYDQIVKAGGTPDLGAHRDPLIALTKAGELVFRAASTGSQMALMAKPAPRNPPPVPTCTRKPFPPVWAGTLDGVFEVIKPPTGNPSDELPDIINELNQRLREPYSFTTFAANRQQRSVNFGCLVTYRQCWCPVVYQAGRIAKTLTLAPKEVQKYTKTIRRKMRRAEKEVKHNLSIRKDEMSQTSRLEQEIVSKAQTKTHFEMSAEHSTPGGTGPTSKMSFGREASQNSDQAKKSFRESVIKAAQEFKDEYTLEVTTEESDEYESVEVGELSNPNDELAVTFIFYELQRRYRVSERLHRLTPIVFVAREMPAPHEINESWIIAHDWILRRVLLDDSFVPALDYLCTKKGLPKRSIRYRRRRYLAQLRRPRSTAEAEAFIMRARM